MKKAYFSTAVVSAAVLIALTGCSGGEATKDAAKSDDAAGAAPAALIESGKLITCIDPEYPPLEYYADGTGGDIIGFDADSVKALAAHWGVEPKLLSTSFDGLMPGLQAGKCDIIFGGLYQSEERAQVSDSVAVMNAGPAVLAEPEKAKKLQKPEDLCGLRVATQAASSNSASVAKLSEECVADGHEAIQQTDYPKTAETVLAVLNGKADALVETNVAAAYMATQNEGKLAVAGEVFEPDTTFGVFTVKGSKLIPDLQKALRAMYDDGTLTKIAEQYNLEPSILDVY